MSETAAPILVVQPRPNRASGRLREVWRHRQLVRFFGRRLIEKSYVRTWLGKLWIPLRPVLDVATRVLIFGALLSVPSSGVPYFLFFLVGMSAWQLFASTTTWATRSLELNRRFLKRLYVPRLAPLISSVAPGLLVYAIYLVLLALAACYYLAIDGEVYVEIGLGLAVAAAGLAISLTLALAIGLWTSVYGAQARDVRFALSYLLGFWFFLTPVIYPLTAIPSEYRSIAELNPMTAPVEMVKYGLLGVGEVPMLGLAVTLMTIVVIAVPGLVFFRRSESMALDSL